MKTISIIIPHKNSIDLLGRAINSIPELESVEIIVVDNSDKPINANDVLTDKKFHLYYSSPVKGAGAARNVGLDNAQGEYILFMDADDYFTEYAEDIFLNVEDYDIAFFICKSVYSTSGNASNRAEQYVRLFDCYKKHPTMDNSNKIRFYYSVPWGKIYKSQFIHDNKIRFDEVPASNDIMFTTKAAVCAKTWKIYQRTLYVVTTTENSLTQTLSGKNLKSRFSVYIRHNKYLKKQGFSKYCIDLLKPLRNLFKLSVGDGLWGVSQLLKNRANLFDFIYKYL